MSSFVRYLSVMLALIAVLSTATPRSVERGKPMSFNNRLLLNRLAVNGHKTLEVLLLTAIDQFDQQLARVEQLGGYAARTEAAIGYIRAVVSIDRLLLLVDHPGIEAYQITSLSKNGWYRDAAPQENAANFKRHEASAVVSPSSPPSTGPFMSVDEGHRINRAADVDVGIDRWLEQHPTYDGRGVTIALIETALVEFDHPAFQAAKALDGTTLPKFEGIFNPLALDEADQTRVDLSTELTAVSSWTWIDRRTYIVPRPGRYRFGRFTLPAGGNLLYEFGVLRDMDTAEIRVDTDGDADFLEETPIAPSTDAVHTQQLHVSTPRDVDITFAVTEDRSPRYVHVYPALDGHHTMTASVAAGNRNDASLAYGVAPGARILLVRNTPADGSARALLETYLDAMQRPDVDIVCTSMGIAVVPTSERDFTALFFTRLLDTFKKPIINSGGNGVPRSSSTWSVIDEFAVGGAMSPATSAALYGGAPHGMVVDPRAAGGPALNGALKPDFVAPVNRIAASLLRSSPDEPLQDSSRARLPHGYQISCCTSATSPYAAGVVALLMSAAKQADVPYSVANLRRALYASARQIPGWATYQQGAGLLNVEAAWAELQRGDDFPAIEVAGPNAHLLSGYSAVGTQGPGLFEREGWAAGMRGQRSLTFTRTSGPAAPTHYRVSWTGNDGTFASGDSIVLALSQPAALPVHVHPKSSGAHSAILNLHDVNGAIVSRTHLMVVAAESFDEKEHSLRATGTVSLFGAREHFVAVPPGVQAMRIELQVKRGRPAITLVRSDTVLRAYYFHVDPSGTRNFPPGTYSLLVPLPTAGVWSITVSNASPVRGRDYTNPSTDEAEYDLSVHLLTGSLVPRLSSPHTIAVDIANAGASIEEPAVDISTGTLRVHEARLSSDGLPSQIPIDVPRDTSTMLLKLRGLDSTTGSLDLHLYDCTGGECFSYDFTLPPASLQELIVRTPKPGRWIATVNSAPTPVSTGRFVLDEVLASNVVRHAVSDRTPRKAGNRWREVFQLTGPLRRAVSGAIPVALVELVDAAAERDALAHPWENHEALPNLGERRVAISSAVLRLPN